jgi:hypothetical protein
MGVEKLHSLGREQDIRALFESAFGTFRRPAPSGSQVNGNARAIQSNNANLQKDAQAITRKFTNPLSRDHSSRIKHKIKCDGNIETDIVPSGTLGVAPDIYPLLFMGIGGMVYTMQLEITAYASMAGDTFSITLYDNLGNAQVESFAEPGDFTAATSNAATATSLAAEINTRDNMSATVVSSTKVRITFADNIVNVVCASNLGSTWSGIKVEFLTNNRQRDLGSLTVIQKMSTLMRAMVGSWVEETTIKTNSSSQPTITFKLGGKNLITTGSSGIASVTDSDTLVLDAETALEVNSMVAFEDSNGVLDTNTDAGYLVSANTAGTVDFSTAHNASDTDTIYPHLPTPVYVGEAISDVSGSFEFDGAPLDIVNFELTIKNNIKPHEDNAFQETVSDYTTSWREIEGKFSIRCNSDEVENLTAYYSNRLLDHDIVAVFGETAAYKMTVELPRINITKMPVTTPNDGDVMMDIEFIALASDYDQSDAITITFD